MSHGNLLSLREATQHAKCAQCVRYKMLIKKLAGDEVARKHQLHEYERHLGKQYLDRTVYWSARNSSRLPLLPTGRPSICIITDAIDHSKFRFPRSRAFTSKEFDRFVRPTLDVTACIAHGRFFLLALSGPTCAEKQLLVQ